MNDVSKRPLQGTPGLQLQTEGEEAMNPGVRPSPADEPDRLSDAENQTEQALTRGPSPTQQGTDRQQAGAHDAFSPQQRGRRTRPFPELGCRRPAGVRGQLTRLSPCSKKEEPPSWGLGKRGVCWRSLYGPVIHLAGRPMRRPCSMTRVNALPESSLFQTYSPGVPRPR